MQFFRINYELLSKNCKHFRIEYSMLNLIHQYRLNWKIVHKYNNRVGNKFVNEKL